VKHLLVIWDLYERFTNVGVDCADKARLFRHNSYQKEIWYLWSNRNGFSRKISTLTSWIYELLWSDKIPGFPVNFTMTPLPLGISGFFLHCPLRKSMFFPQILANPSGNPMTFYSTPWNFNWYPPTGRLRNFSGKVQYFQNKK